MAKITIIVDVSGTGLLQPLIECDETDLKIEAAGVKVFTERRGRSSRGTADDDWTLYPWHQVLRVSREGGSAE